MSFADELPACEDSDFTRKTKRQVSRWQGDFHWEKPSDNVVAEIDAALANVDYSDCDRLYVKVTRFRVAAKSSDPQVAIPILQYFVENTTSDTNDEWEEQVKLLSLQYRRIGDLDALLTHSTTYTSAVDGYDKGVLQRSSLLAKAGLGQVESLKTTLEGDLDDLFDEFKIFELHLLYALALRTNDNDLAERIQALAEEQFGGLHAPKPLPLIDGDILDSILARELGARYKAEILKHPTPGYPLNALDNGFEAKCDVMFDIDVEGRPQNIEPICSHSAFVSSARKAVRNMKYRPLVIEGETYQMTSVRYPFEYLLD